jgi:hypothetical protein
MASDMQKYLETLRELKGLITSNTQVCETVREEVALLNMEFLHKNKENDRQGKTVDNLYEDPVIATQQWCCISFVSPEGLKNCNVRAVKIRGVYATKEEATRRASQLQKLDPDFHIFVGEVGKWLEWDSDPNTVDEQEYGDKKLQNLVTEYKKNRAKAKMMEEERRKEILDENVRREAMKKNKTTLIEDDTEELEKKSDKVDVKELENKLSSEKDKLVQKETELNKATADIATVDDKINQLQKMYKEMLQKKNKQNKQNKVEIDN